MLGVSQTRIYGRDKAMTDHQCRHDYETEQAEQAQREAHEDKLCGWGCPYCLDEKAKYEQER
jgi:hypothetical protein